MARKRLLSPETQPRSVKVKREDDDVPNIKREVSPENDTTDARLSTFGLGTNIPSASARAKVGSIGGYTLPETRGRKRGFSKAVSKADDDWSKNSKAIAARLQREKLDAEALDLKKARDADKSAASYLKKQIMTGKDRKGVWKYPDYHAASPPKRSEILASYMEQQAISRYQDGVSGDFVSELQAAEMEKQDLALKKDEADDLEIARKRESERESLAEVKLQQPSAWQERRLGVIHFLDQQIYKGGLAGMIKRGIPKEQAREEWARFVQNLEAPDLIEDEEISESDDSEEFEGFSDNSDIEAEHDIEELQGQSFTCTKEGVTVVHDDEDAEPSEDESSDSDWVVEESESDA